MGFFVVPASNTNWFNESGPTANLVRITRFVSDTEFATEEGGYGSVIRLAGINPECLSNEALQETSAAVLRAQRLIAENISLLQTFIKKANPALHFSRYAEASKNEVVRSTESARNEFLAGRKFFEVSLYWTVYVHPPRQKKGVSFEKESAKMLRDLRVCVGNLGTELVTFGSLLLRKAEIFKFFGYLCNLEDSHVPRLTAETKPLFEELFQSSADWHRYGLVFNEKTIRRRVAQPFSLLRFPKKPTAAMFAGLLSIPAELIVTIESRRESTAATLREVKSHENFMEFFKHNPLVHYFHRNKPLPKSAASNAADAAIEMDGLGGIVFDVSRRGLAYCKASVLGMVHAHSDDELRDAMAAVHRVFGESEAKVFEEGYGALTAYQAMFPGATEPKGLCPNLNLWRRWIREDHLASMSLWFAPERGCPMSQTLEDESLAILETRSQTPYYFDQFDSGPRGVIVTGEPRRGKTFFVNFQVDHEAKYGGYVFIYDVGGAYENVVLKHGGAVVKIGLRGPRFNPFALENTEENRNQTARLIMLLLQHGGAALKPHDEAGIRKSVDAIYRLDDPKLRRLQWLCLSPELQPYLGKWVEGGVYSRCFDNETDDLQLARIISFDFEGLSGPDRDALMEPLLFWIRLRIGELVRAAGNLALPKLEIYDEVWRLIEDESVVRGIFETMKTGGKKLGGIILCTQDTHDLGPHSKVIRNACPDAVFLGGAFDRQQYAELFQMNDNQMDILQTLRRGEMLLLRRNHALVVRLAVDKESQWTYSTHPQDVRRRNEAVAKHGLGDAIRLLALSEAAK